MISILASLFLEHSVDMTSDAVWCHRLHSGPHQHYLCRQHNKPLVVIDRFPLAVTQALDALLACVPEHLLTCLVFWCWLKKLQFKASCADHQTKSHLLHICSSWRVTLLLCAVPQPLHCSIALQSFTHNFTWSSALIMTLMVIMITIQSILTGELQVTVVNPLKGRGFSWLHFAIQV